MQQARNEQQTGRKRQRMASLFLLLAIAVTLAAIAAYRIIPPHQLHLIPSTQWNRSLLSAYDVQTTSASEWVNGDTTHLRCNIKNQNTPYACGLDLYLGPNFWDGVDASRYTHLIIKSNLFGNAPKVRLFIRNYNPEYSTREDGNSGKFMQLKLKAKEFNNHSKIKINLEEFSVADWWVDQRDLDRKNLPIEFSNVTTLGFDFSLNLKNVSSLELKLHEVYFEGPRIKEQHWYLGILVFWLSIALLSLSYLLLQLFQKTKKYSQEITQLASDKEHFKKQTQKYKELSHLDRLTGALNRLGLETHLKKTIEDSNTTTALIVLDIDHFKRINDRRGHDAGDLILNEISRIIQNNIRSDDLFARWGGEEFVLIAPSTPTQTAQTIAEKIRTKIASHKFIPEKPIPITCSFGVTQIQAGEAFDVAFKRADIALYMAKNQGRNCVVINDS